ncbi:MAG: hypothetical protein ACYC0V_03400 [Armatimonadota bacterium]
MRYLSTFLCMFMIYAGASQVAAQSVAPDIDPSERKGERPYEMVWASRTETASPTISFESINGWKMKVEGGAEGILQLSRAQNLWERPLAKLRYRGNGSSGAVPKILLLPSSPVILPDGSDSIDMWVYGNRWDFVNPPGTPAVRIILHLKDNNGTSFDAFIDTVRWEEWYLTHRKLPSGMKFPVHLESIEIAGGWQTEWREIFIDSIFAYREELKPLTFSPRPMRNLTLPDGQSTGANIGPGKLVFPTREETILPMNFTSHFKNSVVQIESRYIFRYSGKDCTITYQFDASKGLDGIIAEMDGKPIGRMMDGAKVVTESSSKTSWRLKSASLANNILNAVYDDGTELQLRIMQKSLVVDIINKSGQSTELNLGAVTGLSNPRTIWVPFMTYGSTHPAVLLTNSGKLTVYASLHPDWYRSNGSELYGRDNVSGNTAYINGGVRYNKRTDGLRNPMYERVFLTVSPMFEEVLPVIPNPVGLHAAEAVDQLWQETWGPDNYENVMKWSNRLRAYGVRNLIQCNHEISWRDGGESFTMRTRSAPKKGGDEAAKAYVAHQRSLGWTSGLYTNYTDFAPVNEYWNPDFVQRESSGEWRNGWPRCWALKPLRAVEMDALLAPQIKQKYGTNSSYTDVHTAVPPWLYNDHDARVPGAGTFAQTFYAYGELLRNDSKVYDGPIFSEGTYHWLYAGLADGNYGHTYDGRQLANEPLLPAFDLYQIHTKECDIGVSWTTNFCDAMPNLQAPENIDRAIDRFILHTLAYGHIGWLVESTYGMNRTCRSYYMLQQVQARYGLKPPVRIAYWNGKKLVNTSKAIVMDIPRTRRQLFVEYPGGLKLWLNDHQSEDWRIVAGGQTIVLPPAGWAVWQGKELMSYSAIRNGNKADYLKSNAYVYQDGRGQWFSTEDAASNGGLAIMPISASKLEVIRISGDGEFAIRRPFSVMGLAVSCESYDQDGTRLADPVMSDSGNETWIKPVKDAIKYIIQFSGNAVWNIALSDHAAVAGGIVKISTGAEHKLSWQVDGHEVKDGQVVIPADAAAGQLIRVIGVSRNDKRIAIIRVGQPVIWRRKVQQIKGGVNLQLVPAWNFDSLSMPKLTLEFTTTPGWSVTPQSISLNPNHFPETIELSLVSSAVAGQEGKLTVNLTGLPQSDTTEFSLKCTARDTTIADIKSLRMSWGIAPGRSAEVPDTAATGATCYLDAALSVGGTAKPGVFMHPPYMGMIGYTWAEFGEVELPHEPCEFVAFVGIRDGGDKSDGVTFMVELVDAHGIKHKIAEQSGIQQEWRILKGDLTPFAGQRVKMRLIADPGPSDNTATDWACWGEPIIRLTVPGVMTDVSESSR